MGKKRVGILFLGLVLAMGLMTGCSREKKADAESILQAMDKALQKAETGYGSWQMELVGMTPADNIEDVPFVLDITGDTAWNRKAGKSSTKADVDIAYRGEEDCLEVLAFTEEKEKKGSTVCARIGEQWYLKESEDTEPENRDSRIPEWGALKDVLTLAEEVRQENDVSCRVLEGDVPVEISGEWIRAWKNWLGTDLTGLEAYPVKIRLMVREEDSMPQRFDLRIRESEEEEGKTRLTELQFTWKRSEGEEGPAEIPQGAADEAERIASVESIAEAWLADRKGPDYLGSGTSMWERLPNAVMVREYAPEDEEAVIYAGNDTEIRLQRVYTNEAGEAYVDFLIRNDTAKDMNVFSNRTAINHVMSEANMSLDIAAGEEKTACLYFPETAQSGETPAILSLDLEGYDLKQYNTLFRSGLMEVKLGSELTETVLREGGETVYEDGWIRADAYPADTSDEHQIVIPLGILNKSAANLNLSGEPVTVAGKPVDTYISTEVLAGYISYTSLSITRAELKKAGIETVSDIRFTLELKDMKNRGEIKTTEEIVIP